MLYERWRQIARERGDDLALRELSSGRHWSFAELARASESAGPAAGTLVFPQGHSADFVVEVARAWRAGAIVCPLEPSQEPPRCPVPPLPCCHLKITSATTGQPRLIAFAAGQLAADADNIVATMGLRPDWPNLAVISMAHSYGFSNLVLPLLLHGIPLMIAPSTLPEAVRRAMAQSGGPLTLPAVPALWRMWDEARVALAPVRLAISAGAPLPVTVEQAVFASQGLKIHNFYGSSECGGIAYDVSTQPRTDDACVGSPLQNVELALNQDGCLEVRSRAVGESYWPEASPALGGGIFHTADQAEMKDNLVYLRGRLSDQINVAGRKVWPQTVEQVLSSHPAVGECLVFGVPAGAVSRGEVIVACVVALAPVTGEELRRFLLERLPVWQAPRDWWFVEALTANKRGKISRADWRQRYLQERQQDGLQPG